MEPTINEKTQVVAERDGWKQSNIHITLAWRGRHRQHWHNLDYHTNIATLWPVAKKVKEETTRHYMTTTEPINDQYINAVTAINKTNNTFDTLQLFNAVYSAIMLLKKYENGISQSKTT